jgi:hypothetical protein
MKDYGWFARPRNQQPSFAGQLCATVAMAAAMLFVTAEIAGAQATPPSTSTPETKLTTPEGYTSHQSVDLGGRIANPVGSEAMYNTLVNLHSGPRVLGESYELRALPGHKSSWVDTLRAFGSGFGGDPNIMAKLDANKGKWWEFSGLFRRDRLYSDYDLLANPNIPPGLSMPIGPSNAPTGQLAWPQVYRSPVMFNTVRRMTDTGLTFMPLSKFSYRFAYDHYTMEGPTLSPSYTIMKYNALLKQYQRNGSDDYMGGIDWKPSQATTVSFEFNANHYKMDSHFELDPNGFIVQEADGTPAYLGNFTSFVPYAGAGLTNVCNTASMGSDYTSSTVYTFLRPPNKPGGLPIINPACAVVTSYLRTQPTRTWLPTETLRFQTSALRNITMNGEAQYTLGHSNMPSYYESAQGFSSPSRPPEGWVKSIVWNGGNAKVNRHSFGASYAISWKALPTVILTDQVNYLNVAEPGNSTIPPQDTLYIPPTLANANDMTINYSGPLTPGKGNLPHGILGVLTPNYYGQAYVTNNATVTWDATPRSIFSLTYRFISRDIGQGVPHNVPIDTTTDPVHGTVHINENGGIFTFALHPATNWDLNGSADVAYADNAFTSIGQRQLQLFRIHTLYRPRTWATVTGSFSDRERRNNTNHNIDSIEAGDQNYDGPIAHEDHNRIGSVGVVMLPSERYNINFNYSYSDVYAATNICYSSGATATVPGAAQVDASGAPNLCSGGKTWFARDFMHAPTNIGSVAVTFNVTGKVQTNAGYMVSAVNGSRFFNDARDVNGSMESTWQTPFFNLNYAMHPGLVWKAEYNYYGYGEGGPSGAPLCSNATSPAAVIFPCSSSPLTGVSIGPTGATLPRNFHANNVTLGVHIEF